MIELSDLTKKFDTFTAVDHLNLRIETGEFFGLLGPNGAGKTTTISLMSTLLLPTEGEIRVDGEVLSRKNPGLKRKISVITQEYSMRQDMTMDEVMEYQGRLYFMPRKKIREKTEELLEFCGLIDFRRRTVRKLSGGMKRKLMVCRALLTEPEILLTADPALTLRKAPDDEVDSVLLRSGIPPRGQYLCFALRRWKGFEEKAPIFGAAAEYAYRTYGLTPVFVAVEKHLDPGAGQLAARGLTIPHYFLDDAGGAGTIIGALSRMQAVVSMRLHALIFAAGQGIPLAGVVYDPKVSAFLRYIGQEQFVDLADLTEENLRSMIDQCVAQATEG
mgnify:CR=1 FL=1